MAFLMPTMDDGTAWREYGTQSIMMGAPTGIAEFSAMDSMLWSLNSYKESVKSEEGADREEKWDELEKSIVSKLADDVRIGMKSDHVVMEVVMANS